MSQLADLHGAVSHALSSGRLGTPVFVRYLYHRALNGPAIGVRLVQTVRTVREWMGRGIERAHALGSLQSRHVTLTVEFRGGATALITWIGLPGRGDGVDLTVVGNHGSLYHDSGTAELWDEPAQVETIIADPALAALIDRALRSGQPESAGGQP